MASNEPDRILLNMQDRTKAPQGADKENGADLFSELDRQRILRESKDHFSDWKPALAEVGRQSLRPGLSIDALI